jgi:hypothetical protein
MKVDRSKTALSSKNRTSARIVTDHSAYHISDLIGRGGRP